MKSFGKKSFSSAEMERGALHSHVGWVERLVKPIARGQRFRHPNHPNSRRKPFERLSNGGPLA